MDNERSQCTAALECRTRLNQSQGSADLAVFIARHLVPAGRSLLDVGSGSGEILAGYLSHMNALPRTTALDLSLSSLRVLVQHQSLTHVRVVHADMDELSERGASPQLYDLDHVVIAYALYYSRDPRALLEALAARLSPRGMFVVIGPAPGNNREWFALLDQVDSGIAAGAIELSESFSPNVVERFASARFERVQVAELENRVSFRDAADLERYWRSNTYFQAEWDLAVTRAIQRECRDAPFRVTKRVRLVRMEVQR